MNPLLGQGNFKMHCISKLSFFHKILFQAESTPHCCALHSCAALEHVSFFKASILKNDSSRLLRCFWPECLSGRVLEVFYDKQASACISLQPIKVDKVYYNIIINIIKGAKMTEYLIIVTCKIVIGFAIVIAHLNFSGKTQLAQMTPIDFFGNFVLGAVIGGVIYNNEISMLYYIILLIISVVFLNIISFLSKKIDKLRSITIGKAIVIIDDNKLSIENVNSNKVDIVNIISKIHSRGIKSLAEIYFAQIEPDGQLTIVLEKDKWPSLVFNINGKYQEEEIEKINKNKDWVESYIKNAKIDDDSIYIIEYASNTLNIVDRDGVLYKITTD